MTKYPYHNYIFFSVHNDFYQLPKKDQEIIKKEFGLVLTSVKKMSVSVYVTLGLKAHTTFMLWCSGKSPSDVQTLLRDILRTASGKYFSVTVTYFGIIRNSEYSGRTGKPEQDMQEFETRLPFLVLYPFTKTTDWHVLDHENRKSIMGQHIKVGLSYPAIRQCLLYSYGLDDQEFVVSYEMKTLEEFQDLIISMRRTIGRKYTLRDTPTYTCVYKTLSDFISWL